jgi:NADH-quinone oxidoreductase subunit G
MDVCPVGAITTRDYRFKSRPWDNPEAADTICTQCSKGCNVTAWIKAKPEWAKGSRLVRFTPRFNPEVNDYWMCDIGRFNYHWIEGDDRARQPLARLTAGETRDGAAVLQQPVAWTEMYSRLRDRLDAAGKANPDGVRFLLSGHASHEELFLFRRLAEELMGQRDDSVHPAITVAWRYEPKPQPEHTKFNVPPVDAPNVNGARMLGLAPGKLGDGTGPADVSALRTAVEGGKVAALYVFDPGPAGSVGDTRWIVDARRQGVLQLLIVQGVLLTELARAADFVLPGASYVEKEACYTNDKGRLQGTARAILPPGEAMEDWEILVNLSVALGVPLAYTSTAHIRADIAARFGTVPGLAGIASLAFGQPTPAKHWLQSSNPSERWKWDFMFQDLPPVKGQLDPSALPLPPGAIELREVK